MFGASIALVEKRGIGLRSHGCATASFGRARIPSASFFDGQSRQFQRTVYARLSHFFAASPVK
jgi:hypothetical protein